MEVAACPAEAAAVKLVIATISPDGLGSREITSGSTGSPAARLADTSVPVEVHPESATGTSAAISRRFFGVNRNAEAALPFARQDCLTEY
jgi:hypothetical protein